MDSTLKIWVVIAVVGALNYFSRLSFIAFFARRSVPPPLARALKYVPSAMLAALIVPMIVVAGPATGEGIVTPRVLAAAVAVAIAYVTHSTLKTLVAGMVVLWVAQALWA
jgi:branched-subunit amino acid transport protein